MDIDQPKVENTLSAEAPIAATPTQKTELRTPSGPLVSTPVGKVASQTPVAPVNEDKAPEPPVDPEEAKDQMFADFTTMFEDFNEEEAAAEKNDAMEGQEGGDEQPALKSNIW